MICQQHTHLRQFAGSVAKRAADAGLADGILVSAHGGRQLDGVPAPVSKSSTGGNLSIVLLTSQNLKIYANVGIFILNLLHAWDIFGITFFS